MNVTVRFGIYQKSETVYVKEEITIAKSVDGTQEIVLILILGTLNVMSLIHTKSAMIIVTEMSILWRSVVMMGLIVLAAMSKNQHGLEMVSKQ